jgi:hypothetical protein
LHAPTPQVPLMHTGEALFTAEHARPQAPQLFTSLWVLTSQPSTSMLLQFAKPPLQVKVHVLLAHTVAALARVGQALLQAPQLVVLLVVFTSQPLPPLASQSAKPGRQP